MARRRSAEKASPNPEPPPPEARKPARAKRLAAKPRKKKAAASDDNGDAYSASEPAPALLPRVVFGLLLLLLGAIAFIEIRNALRHPSVRRVTGPPGAPALTFYQKGYASAREAWLFDEPRGTAGPPRLIHRIDCRPQARDLGEIRWTADGRAVYAAGRTNQARGVPLIRWFYEFQEPPPPPGKKASVKPNAAKTLAASPEDAGRLFVATPEDAMPGRTAFVETAAALTDRWRQHGGAGPVAAVWYDLGKQGPHLFSWQTTRWENALPE